MLRYKWRSNTAEVVEPVAKTNLVSQDVEKKHDLGAWPADDESTAYDQRRLDSVAAGFARGGTVWKRLKILNKKLSYAENQRVSYAFRFVTGFNGH